jgi:1-acyl-sn-glycerol-3-phosphate acyltransferase
MKVKALVCATLRGTQFVLQLALGIVLAGIYRLRYGRHWHLTQPGQAIIRWWMQHVTRIIGIHITQYGRPLTAQVLFVSNHISFLDIIVIASVVPVRFLAKHSVRYWPIIGYLTALSGSLFIRRGKHSQLVRTLAAMKQALAKMRPILIFPEGTTSLGTQVLKFHSGLFQAAIDKRVPVQPLSLYYCHRQQPDRLAAYIDQDNFLISLLRLMARPQTEVHLSFTPPVDSDGHTRHSLAAFCHARISQNLQYQLHHSNNPRPFDAPAEFAILGECEQ